jgi:hypothetical protein
MRFFVGSKVVKGRCLFPSRRAIPNYKQPRAVIRRASRAVLVEAEPTTADVGNSRERSNSADSRHLKSLAHTNDPRPGHISSPAQGSTSAPSVPAARQEPASQALSSNSGSIIEWSDSTRKPGSSQEDDNGIRFAQEARSRRGRGRSQYDPSLISYKNVPFKVGDAVVGRVSWCNDQGARVTIKGFEEVEGCVPGQHKMRDL